MSKKLLASNKQYKFSIGGIFFILSAILIACCQITRILFGIIFYKQLLTGRFFFQNIIGILTQGYPGYGNFDFANITFVILTVIAFLAIGIVLLTKQRSKLMLVAPVVVSAASLLMMVYYLEVFINQLDYYFFPAYTTPSFNNLLQGIFALIAAVGFALIIGGNVAFYIITDAALNEKTPAKKLVVWISPVAIALGTLALTLQTWLGYVVYVINLITNSQELTFRNIYPLDHEVEYALLFILLTAAYLFATLWIINPNKKQTADKNDSSSDTDN